MVARMPISIPITLPTRVEGKVKIGASGILPEGILQPKFLSRSSDAFSAPAIVQKPQQRRILAELFSVGIGCHGGFAIEATVRMFGRNTTTCIPLWLATGSI